MIIQGSRGHGEFVGMLLESVSAACAEHAHCPVLIVHASRNQKQTPADNSAEASSFREANSHSVVAIGIDSREGGA